MILTNGECLPCINPVHHQTLLGVLCRLVTIAEESPSKSKLERGFDLMFSFNLSTMGKINFINRQSNPFTN